MHKTLIEQYELTAKRCRRAFLDYGLSEHDFKQSEKIILANRSDEAANMVLVGLVSKTIRKRKVSEMLELNNLVREFQALVNHCVYVDESGPVSRLLWLAQESAHEVGSRVPNDWTAYMQLGLEAHRRIDGFTVEQLDSRSHELAKMKDRMRKLGHDEEMIRRVFESEDHDDDEEFDNPYLVAAVAHHTLDWYLQVSPQNAYRKTAEKLAASSFYIVKRINEHVMGWAMSLSLDDLARFGGWVSGSSLPSSTAGAFYEVIYNAVDLSMLLIIPPKAPDDWREKLSLLAPGLFWEEE